MPWSGGTFTRNNGSTSGATAWAQLDAGGEAILSSRHDTADQDLATGINLTLHKGGQNSPTANLPMGGFKHTGVANGTATNHYAAVGQVQNSSFMWAGTSSGTDTITASVTPNLTAYADGQRFSFIAGGTNTGAATLNIDSVGAADIKKGGDGTTALAAGDIVAGGIYTVIYNDTTDDFELQNPQTDFGDRWSDAVDANIVPDGDGTRDLGSSSNGFDDLFLASGSVINFNNGNVTLTHSSDTVTVGGTSAVINFADKLLQRPVIRDYGETINAIGSIGGGTQDIDLTLGNVVSGTVDTSTTTFTFSNPPASGTCGSFSHILTNGGSQTVNWPASVDWAGGSAPSLTSSGVDILTFFTLDGGTIWYGFVSGLDMS